MDGEAAGTSSSLCKWHVAPTELEPVTRARLIQTGASPGSKLRRSRFDTEMIRSHSTKEMRPSTFAPGLTRNRSTKVGVIKILDVRPWQSVRGKRRPRAGDLLRCVAAIWYYKRGKWSHLLPLKTTAFCVRRILASPKTGQLHPSFPTKSDGFTLASPTPSMG